MGRKRRIKPNTLELSLAFNPKTKRRFFMRKEKEMPSLVEILENAEPLLEEEKLDEMFKSMEMTPETVEAVKGSLRILSSVKENLPEDLMGTLAKDLPDYSMFAGVVQEMSKDELNELRASIEKDLRSKMKKSMSKDADKISELTAKMEEMKKDLAEARKDVQMSKDIQRKMEIRSELEELGAIGDLDKLTNTMFAADKVSPEMYKDLLEQQKSTVAMIKAAGIEVEIGSAVGGAPTMGKAYKELIALADKAMEKDGVSHPKAWRRVIRDNPKLYREYLNERK